MIWVIGGTKDSRDFIERFSLKNLLVVTTATEYGAKLLEEFKEIKTISKKLDKEMMKKFVDDERIDIVVDISHPYAEEVSKNAIDISKSCDIFYIRYERERIKAEFDGVEFTDIESLVNYVEKLDKNILVTLGSNNVEKFKNLKNLKNIYFRVLPKWEMIKKVEDCGVLPKNIIAMQGPFSKEINKAIMREFEIGYMVTKNSGEVGGEIEKIESARECGVKIIGLGRPNLEYPYKVESLESLEKIVLERINKNKDGV